MTDPKPNPNSPQAILNKHIELQPDVVLIVSLDSNGGMSMDVSGGSGTLHNIAFMYQCLGIQVTNLLRKNVFHLMDIPIPQPAAGSTPPESQL